MCSLFSFLQNYLLPSIAIAIARAFSFHMRFAARERQTSSASSLMHVAPSVDPTLLAAFQADLRHTLVAVKATVEGAPNAVCIANPRRHLVEIHAKYSPADSKKLLRRFKTDVNTARKVALDRARENDHAKADELLAFARTLTDAFSDETKNDENEDVEPLVRVAVARAARSPLGEVTANFVAPCAALRLAAKPVTMSILAASSSSGSANGCARPAAATPPPPLRAARAAEASMSAPVMTPQLIEEVRSVLTPQTTAKATAVLARDDADLARFQAHAAAAPTTTASTLASEHSFEISLGLSSDEEVSLDIEGCDEMERLFLRTPTRSAAVAGTPPATLKEKEARGVITPGAYVAYEESGWMVSTGDDTSGAWCAVC